MTIRSINEYIFGEKALDVDFGVEIEIEGTRLTHLHDSPLVANWRIEGDGSLRNGIELVMRDPIKFASLRPHLHLLADQITAKRVKINQSDRTGVHLHLNVGDLTPKELVIFLCLYYILEEAIVETCGENRIGNHFCLRAIDAEYLIQIIVQSINHSTIYELRNEAIRYSALNLCALFKYGTVEFRAIQTQPQFVEPIMRIAWILHNLKINCKGYKHPQEILNEFSGLGCKSLVDKIITHKESKDLLLSLPRIEEMCRRGMYFAQDIVYATEYKEDFSWGLASLTGSVLKKKNLNRIPEMQFINTNMQAQNQVLNWEIRNDGDDDEA